MRKESGELLEGTGGGWGRGRGGGGVLGMEAGAGGCGGSVTGVGGRYLRAELSGWRGARAAGRSVTAAPAAAGRGAGGGQRPLTES